MFDFSFGELALLAVIALLVVGPEKLPGLARSAGRWYGSVRRMMGNARTEMEQQLLIDELRQEAQNLRDQTAASILDPEMAEDSRAGPPPANVENQESLPGFLPPAAPEEHPFH